MKLSKLLFFVLMFLGFSKVLAATDCTQVTQIPQIECEALVAFYNSTGGPNWIDNTGWNESNTPCDWIGVFCFGNDHVGDHVFEIAMASNGLVGFIPPELGNLSEMKFLYIDENQLTGSIPPELGNLTNLVLFNLSRNPLTGSIPAELGNLSNLQSFYLGNTQISGSIPPELGNLSRLRELSLIYNQLSGSIPAELGNLSSLQSLSLVVNQLSGSIPAELGNLKNLQIIELNNNQLSGLIPMKLGNLDNLQSLDLGFNQLSGSIPTKLGNLSNLRMLSLRNNQLCGGIPLSLINLNNLFFLDLEDNGLNVTNLAPELEEFFNNVIVVALEPQNPSICPTSLATLATFEAIPNSKKVLLKWRTLFEDQNAGYFIWRGQPNNSQCTSNLENYHDIVLVGFEASKGNGFSGTTYLYQDHTVKPKTTYCYLLEDRDFGSNRTFHWDSIVSVTTD
ncbi:MAG: hypothetical protein HC877_14535 [Thioploca sp.]|nr:hypothetical protein [Thioploca sp.]